MQQKNNVTCNQATDKTEFTSTNVRTPKILHIAFDSTLYPKPNPGETRVSTIELLDQPEYRYIPDTVSYYQCSYRLVAAIFMKPGHYVSIGTSNSYSWKSLLLRRHG